VASTADATVEPARDIPGMRQPDASHRVGPQSGYGKTGHIRLFCF
jgi:hypothetical protein